MDYRLKKINFFDLPIGTVFTWNNQDNNIAWYCYYVGIKINNDKYQNATCINFTAPYPPRNNHLTISIDHYIEIPGKTIIV